MRNWDDGDMTHEEWAAQERIDGIEYDRQAEERDRFREDEPSEPEDGLCVRWGSGADRCIRPYDHLGQCEDSAGNSTLSLLSLARRYLR